MWWGGLVYQPGMKVISSHLLFSDNTWSENTSLCLGKLRNEGSLLGFWWQGKGWSFGLSVGFVGIGQLLSFCFARLPFTVCFTFLERADCTWIHFISSCCHFWVVGSSITQFRIHEAKIKPRKVTIVSFLGSHILLPSFHLLESSYVFHKCPRFLATLSKRSKEKFICSSLIHNWVIFAL